MRRVKFKSLDAGPAGVRQPGSVHPLRDDEADALVKGGYAEYVDHPPRENATRPAPPANMMQPPSQPTRGGDNRPGRRR